MLFVMYCFEHQGNTVITSNKTNILSHERELIYNKKQTEKHIGRKVRVIRSCPLYQSSFLRLPFLLSSSRHGITGMLQTNEKYVPALILFLHAVHVDAAGGEMMGARMLFGGSAMI